MSHLIEEYAKCLGVKVSRPKILSHYFPINFDKYITIQTTNKFQSRDYAHWDQVVYLLKKYISDISIVQVGEKENPLAGNIDLDLRGKTTIKQLCYVAEKSILHVGIDSLCVHLASAYNKPVVGLYSNMWPANSGPIWGGSFTCINSPKDGNKASYAIEEDPKTIDGILPEDIAEEVLELLGIDNNLFNKYKTLNIGKHYHSKILEVVPDFKPNSDFNPKRLVNLRCDYHLDEEILTPWLHKRVNLMINKKINPNVLYYFKKNIAAITIFLDDSDVDLDYLSQLSSLNIKHTLICKDENKINDYRFNFFDFVVNGYDLIKKKDLDFCERLCDNTYYHSNKTIVSKNKKYSSKASWKAGIEKSGSPEKFIDTDDFWEEIDYLNIYNYAEDKTRRQ